MEVEIGVNAKGMQILLDMNSQLEAEVSRLCAELNELSKGVLKRGFLYKLRDRNISFSSKWGLRYFELVGSTLSYFVDDRDTRPRRVIDLTGCIIVVDGLKRDKYHVVSVVFEGNLLLRISSENAAEMMQWAHMLEVGSRIKQNAASFITLDESSAKNEAENESNIGQVALRRVQSATITLSKARSFASSGALLGSGAFDSTLRSIAPKFSATKSSSSSSSSTGGSQQDSSAGISSSFSSEFPASMPIHVESRPSPLSYDAKQSHQSYRGFFNLGIIILFLSHLRQIMDNANLHGLRVSFSQLYDPSSVHSEVHQFIRLAGQSAIFWCSSILLSFSLEKVASKYFIPERIILCLNFLLGAYNFFVPTLWVWYSEYDPIVSFWFLFQSMILWMKFISYAHVNRDLRRSLRASHQIKSGSLRTKDEDPNGYDNNAKPPTSPAVKDLIMPVIGYPHNITISNLLFFLCVPTLCYQLNYPRTPRIRWRYALTLLLRMCGCILLMVFAFEQYIMPTLKDSVLDVRDRRLLSIIGRLVHLAIPNTYIWLLGFYWFFHVWLNFSAEITRFGDRLFYKDWWNARSIDIYWRNWNNPVHSWCLRHLYHPLLRNKASKAVATLAVFFFSAVMHEVCLSIPFRHISYHAFFGMMAQAPLVHLTRKLDRYLDNALLGNVIFWCSFCVVGQPMGVILYYFDLWQISNQKA